MNDNESIISPENTMENIIVDSDTASFSNDVIEASKTGPVLVDFWADWCAPCKQLTPILEELVKSYKGLIKLVKIDTEKNQELSQQLQIQSLPTVYAFYEGQPNVSTMWVLCCYRPGAVYGRCEIRQCRRASGCRNPRWHQTIL